MNYAHSTKESFFEALQNGAILPLYSEIDPSLCSPRDALGLFDAGRPRALLESARVSETTGRYSFATGDPYLVFRSRGRDVELSLPAAPQGKYGRRVTMQRKPLEKLRELMSNYRTARVAGLPPFTGGVAGFLSYDMVHQFEKLPRTVTDDLHVPDSCFLFVDTVIAFDHLDQRAWVIVNPGAREQELGFRRPALDEWPRLYEEAEQKLRHLASRCAALRDRATAPAAASLSPAAAESGGSIMTPCLSQPEFESMVRRCKEYIAAGDIYQANLSQRFDAGFAGRDPLRLYDVLREINPSPFAAYLDLGDLQLVSSSPERLVRLSGSRADTRPIAGTRRRGRDAAETQELSVELLTNDKERAEHIMLLDLERNDLGKVCSYGTVEVDELMVIEDYSHVIHIVSNVRGELAPGRDCFDLIRAAFPGGTITGVPKVRCMEIIDELEPLARGPYTGSLGYISTAGDMDLNIIIRTFLIKDGKAHAQVGAGIVADSDPEREYIETLQKAEALRRSLAALAGKS